MSTGATDLTTGDLYREFLAPKSRRLNLLVQGAPIKYQLGRGWPPAYDGPESQLPAGQYSLDRVFDAVRIKSSRVGVPALVTVEPISGDQLPAGDA